MSSTPEALGASRIHQQAVARLAVVACAEIVAAGVCWAPIGKWWSPAAPWRDQCWGIANWTTAVAATVLGVAFIYSSLAYSAIRHISKVAEVVSVLIFAINLTSLTTAVTCTGGVGDSFYTPLLSVLLTLVIVFELQKELVAGRPSWSIWLYAFAIAAAWSWASQKSYTQHLTANALAMPHPYRALWTWLLTLLGVLVAVLAYVVPRTEAFRDRVTRARERLELRATRLTETADI